MELLGVEESEASVDREVEEDHESNLVTPEQNHQVPQCQQTENAANDGSDFLLGHFRPFLGNVVQIAKGSKNDAKSLEEVSSGTSREETASQKAQKQAGNEDSQSANADHIAGGTEAKEFLAFFVLVKQVTEDFLRLRRIARGKLEKPNENSEKIMKSNLRPFEMMFG